LLSRTDSVDASGTVAFGYDLGGNQISRTKGSSNRTLAWDARNTLTAVYENGVEVGRYDYDRNLIRIQRTTQNENVMYVLDHKHVLNELDASQTGKPSIRRYHYGSKVLAVTESAGTSYILNDGIGSASDFWNSGGLLAKSRQYDAWGGFRNGTAPGSGDAKVAYTGHMFDVETGNNYMLGRYQDPVLGIFLSRDPFPYAPNLAPPLYVYANDNPLRFWDPDGYMSQEYIDIYRRDEADREGEYYDLVRTKGPDAPLTKRALAELNQLRATITDLEQQKDFDDNVAIPVLQEVDIMVATAPLAVAGAATRIGRVAIFGLSVAGGASGTHKVMDGIEEGDPWKVVGGASEVMLSGVAAKKTGDAVVEDAQGFVTRAGRILKGLMTPSGVATAPVGALPGGGMAPVPDLAPNLAPEPVGSKPMQMANKGGSSSGRSGLTTPDESQNPAWGGKPWRSIVEEDAAARKADALTGKQRRGYEDALDTLAERKAGGNQHALKGGTGWEERH
jgi:RHS repeat-associated protein